MNATTALWCLGWFTVGGMAGLACLLALVKIRESRRWTRAHQAITARRSAPYLLAIERERRASAIAGTPACSAADEHCT